MLVNLISGSALGQEYRQDIFNISLRGGLSQNTTTEILQDSQGFLWIGTQDGLNRYDGFEFKVFRAKEDDTTSLTNNYIRSMAMDWEDNLWLGTQIGLSKYDTRKGTFTQFLTENDPLIKESRWVINDLVIDNKSMWIGTEKGLLFAENLTHPSIEVSSYLPENTAVVQMQLDDRGALWIATGNGDIYSLFKGKPFKLQVRQWASNPVINCIDFFDGQLWVGTNHGLWSIPTQNVDYSSQGSIDIESIIAYDKPVETFGVEAIFKDSREGIWVGTLNEGVFSLDTKTREFQPIMGNIENPGLLKVLTVQEIYEDKQQNIWIGTLETGLFKIKRHSKNFGLLRPTPGDRGLTSNRIRGLMKRDNTLWIGTSRGVTLFDRDSMTFRSLQNDPRDDRSLSSDDVKAIASDRDGNVWIGTNNGLNYVSMPEYEIQRFTADENQVNALILDNKIRCLNALSDGNIWVGTYGGGISVIDPTNLKLIRHYEHNPGDSTSLSNQNVMNIFQDSDGTIWASTYGGGLNRLNTATNTWDQIRDRGDKPFPLLLSSITEDNSGFLWIGTYGNGLIQLNREDLTYSILSEKDGLSNNVTYAAIPKDDHLWISTNFGINRYHIQTGTFTNYNVNDGLQSNEFNTNSYLLCQSGEVFFGGINGLNFFYPDSIVDNSTVPDLAFTDLLIFNESVSPNEVVLNGSPPITELVRDSSKVVLSHFHNVFTVKFTTLDFVSPEDISYAHRLVGFEEDWIYSKTDQRSATYTNLKPGNYEFQMKASNNDGVWSDDSISLFITVKPSIWETLWFRISLGALITAVVVIIISNRINKVERRKKFLEAKINEHTKEISLQNQELKRSSERLTNLNQKKDQMFYLLAHNVRAPLTTIKALIHHYHSDDQIEPKDLNGFFDGLDQNVTESIQLLDNTFYWSKLQFGDLYIASEKCKLSDLVKDTLASLDHELSTKQISIEQVVDEVEIINDRKMLSVILKNLVRNAIKYSYPNSTIKVNSEKCKGATRLVVEDYGIGLTEDELTNLFNEDRNINKLGTVKEKGTGLGLLLSHKLAGKLGCKLTVQGKDSLTRFILEIPV